MTWRAQTLALAALSMAASACGPMSLPPADLVIINGKEPESLDPVIINGQADGRIVSSLFEGLTRRNGAGKPEPGLAKRWSIREDGREYRFYLREGLHWSDGSALTAEDILYSWRRVLEPASACEYAGILYCVRRAKAFHRGEITDFDEVGLRVESPLTLVVSLNQATPYFLDICAFPTLAAVPKKLIERHGDRWLLQSGVPVSGAYTLDFWRLNDRIRLAKNLNYWDRDNVVSDLVDILPTSHPGAALNLYETGAADIIWDRELIPTELVRILRHRPDFHTADFFGTYFLRINTDQAPFQDPRVRRALALSIRRQRIVEKITGAGERIARHLVPPGVSGYESPEGLAYDPAAAKELLKDAGFPNGKGFPPVDYLFNSSKLNEQIAVEIQSMWRENLGVKTNLRQLEWRAYLQDQRELRYGVSRSSWLGDYLDPQTFLEVFASHNGNNRTGWKHAAYDALLEQANSAMTAPTRMQRFRQAEEILVDREVPIIPLYFYTTMECYAPNRIIGIQSNVRAEHPIRLIGRTFTRIEE